MERKCTCCSYPMYNCAACPITLNYWTSLPQGFVISTSGTSSPVSDGRIRKIVKEELEKVSFPEKYKPKNCGIVGTIKIESEVSSFQKAAECIEPDVKTKNLSFEEALTASKAGKWVTRSDWNGKGQYVCMLEGGVELDTLTFRDPFLVLFNTQGEYVPWVPSMGDLFSNQWQIVDR